jgi:hypothetical protein
MRGCAAHNNAATRAPPAALAFPSAGARPAAGRLWSRRWVLPCACRGTAQQAIGLPEPREPVATGQRPASCLRPPTFVGGSVFGKPAGGAASQQQPGRGRGARRAPRGGVGIGGRAGASRGSGIQQQQDGGQAPAGGRGGFGGGRYSALGEKAAIEAVSRRSNWPLLRVTMHRAKVAGSWMATLCTASLILARTSWHAHLSRHPQVPRAAAVAQALAAVPVGRAASSRSRVVCGGATHSSTGVVAAAAARSSRGSSRAAGARASTSVPSRSTWGSRRAAGSRGDWGS